MSSSNLSELESTYGREKQSKRLQGELRKGMSSTSRNSSVLSTNSGPESRYYKMKKCVAVIKEYLQNSTEEMNSLISRYLQALSVTIDVSIFDPHTIIASEFFVSLHELMSKIEARSVIAWYCVDVLSNACRNCSARQAIIKSYQFLPHLSKMLGDQLIREKKIRLLKLMQDITIGIKISWQIPHLAHLMKTLAKWVDSQDEEIVGLSLGILVNLCYKNLPATYTLTSNVDMRKLMRNCVTLGGPLVEAHACKLLIICDQVNEMCVYNLQKLVAITFSSIQKALEDRDFILLRQLVEFYIDVKKDNRGGQSGELFELYEREVADLLKLLDSAGIMKGTSGDQGDTNNLGECMSAVFQFLHHLIEMKMDCLQQFHGKFVSISLQWVQNDVASPKAIDILKNIALSASSDRMDVMKPLGVSLPIFLLALDSMPHENMPTYSEQYRKIGSLLQLLKVLLNNENLRQRILIDLKEQTIYKLFYPLIGEDVPRLECSESITSSEEAVTMFTHALALVDALAKHDVHWVSIRENLLQQRPVHYVLSQGLLSGKQEIKSLIMEMTSLSSFPRWNVAGTMTSIQGFVNLSTPPVNTRHQVFQELPSLVPSVTQLEKLDSLLAKLGEVVANRNFEDMSTSDVMELYEFKLASMVHAERAAMVSVEAASERCTHLQQRTTQLSAETHRLHHLLLNTQQKHQQQSKVNKELEEVIQLTTNSFEAEKGRCRVLQSKLAQEEKLTAKLKEQLQEACDTRDEVEKQQDKLKHLVSKLEENCSRLEKNLTKKEEALRKSTIQNDDFKNQILALEKELRIKQDIVDRQNEELKETVEDLKMKTQIIETITKVAQQHK